MRHFLFGLIIFLHTLPLYALSTRHFPDSFTLSQSPCSNGNYCMAMLDNDQKKIGFLQSAAEYSNLFYFYDEFNQRQLSIKMLKTNLHQEPCSMNYCPLFYDFDIYESSNHVIAKLELSYDVMQASYDGFKLYTKDRRHILVQGSHTTSTGTQSHLVDGIDVTHQLVMISRPLFTYSLDSKISILDPNVISAALALYCNTSLFHANLKPPAENVVTPETLNLLRQKLQDFAENQGLLDDLHVHMSDRAIKAAGKTLSAHYQIRYGDFWTHDSLFDKDKKIQQLFDLGMELILSHSLPEEEEKALLQFLIDQLYVNQPQ
jgi:hypothetical protein